VTGWSLAKAVLAVAGVSLVMLGERQGRPWLGYVGLGLLVAAFALRFVQRRRLADGG
jgi:hypothetical protein